MRRITRGFSIFFTAPMRTAPIRLPAPFMDSSVGYPSIPSGKQDSARIGNPICCGPMIQRFRIAVKIRSRTRIGSLNSSANGFLRGSGTASGITACALFSEFFIPAISDSAASDAPAMSSQV